MRRKEGKKERPADPAEIAAAADSILAEMAAISADVAEHEADLAAALERVHTTYAPAIESLKQSLALREKALKKHMRKHKAVLFKTDDERVSLAHGALIYSKQKIVVKVKGMLETLQRFALKTAIKEHPTVDWDVIEKWDDATLEQLGTRREQKERFEFEISGLS